MAKSYTNKSCCSSKNKSSHSGGVDKVIIAIVLGTLVLLGGTVWVGTRFGQTTAVELSESAVASVEGVTYYDWGTIGLRDGDVEKEFSIHNTGTDVLKLYGFRTSCMCTTMQITTPARTSRTYAMHDNPTDVIEVNPGESAKVNVVFDPNFHGPSGVGSIVRIATLSTNDPRQSEINFRLTAQVVN